jgi:hypothetical protein
LTPHRRGDAAEYEQPAITTTSFQHVCASVPVLEHWR